MSSSWMKTPHSIDLQSWMRARASSLALVWVANLQIPARGRNRPRTLLQRAWEMGRQFVRSQIQLLSGGPHQMWPNLGWKCHNDITQQLQVDSMSVCVYVCVCVCVWEMKREGDREGERNRWLSQPDSWLNCSPENADGESSLWFPFASEWCWCRQQD